MSAKNQGPSMYALLAVKILLFCMYQAKLPVNAPSTLCLLSLNSVTHNSPNLSVILSKGGNPMVLTAVQGVAACPHLPSNRSLEFTAYEIPDMSVCEGDMICICIHHGPVVVG